MKRKRRRKRKRRSEAHKSKRKEQEGKEGTTGTTGIAGTEKLKEPQESQESQESQEPQEPEKLKEPQEKAPPPVQAHATFTWTLNQRESFSSLSWPLKEIQGNFLWSLQKEDSLQEDSSQRKRFAFPLRPLQ